MQYHNIGGLVQLDFDFNKRTLNEQGKAVTETIAKMLASEPTLKVVLQGHADYSGSDSYNDALGMDRARSVRRGC